MLVRIDIKRKVALTRVTYLPVWCRCCPSTHGTVLEDQSHGFGIQQSIMFVVPIGFRISVCLLSVRVEASCSGWGSKNMLPYCCRVRRIIWKILDVNVILTLPVPLCGEMDYFDNRISTHWISHIFLFNFFVTFLGYKNFYPSFC